MSARLSFRDKIDDCNDRAPSWMRWRDLAAIDDDDLRVAEAAGSVINGDADNNILFGTLNDDTIHGLGGPDILYGDGGNDLLHGEDGNDTLYGGQDQDALDGDHGVLTQVHATLRECKYNSAIFIIKYAFTL